MANKTFYESDNTTAQITTVEDLADFKEASATVSSDVCSFIKTAIKYAPKLPDFKDSLFYFLDGTAFNFDKNGAHHEVKGLDQSELIYQSCISAYGLRDASLTEAILRLKELSQNERANVVSQLFDVKLSTIKSPRPAGGKATGRDTRPKVNTPNAETVQKVYRFLTERVSMFDAGEIEKGKYSAKEIYVAVFGRERAVTTVQKSVATVHKAITGFILPGANINSFFTAENIQEIKKGLAQVDREGLEEFTARLQKTASENEGSNLEDFTI
ncbi:hypothetical protein ORL36_16405 [Klebsiella pasteurii]|uniref:hypothetical protein n=1 Tax=Klebsiella TaxID=570 RepID=UPI0022452306|nr:hypothetical protein [Klebsiella pasteurii]MCW9586198.1 hypothetical protein [Klebsiella pasteurii]